MEKLKLFSNIESDSKNLEKLINVLMELHDSNLRPAQPEGLWVHHNFKQGLKLHSLEVRRFLVEMLDTLVQFYTPDPLIVIKGLE
jgi:hypothetical protein